MPTAFYDQPAGVVHTRQRGGGYIQDTGCEVSPTCLGCPLSQCKDDDREWYRRWRKRGKLLLLGQVMERESLTTQDAARRFRVCIRTVQRALQYRRKAARLLTPDDLDVFILLAEAAAHARTELREVA
jgi:hypothetical protein